MHIASYIDHTILKPATTLAEVEKLCMEAIAYQFAAVCVPPPFVNRAKAILAPGKVLVATVVGFPFGYAATEAKLAEAVLALVDGADEIDMVMNQVAFKMNDIDFLKKEVNLITSLVHNKGKVIKLIIESGVLTMQEIISCCSIFGNTGIDYMKTSTGFAEKGASIESVQLMERHLPSEVKIKASGGIRTYQFAKQLVEAGADRLGCSASVEIVSGEQDTGAAY